jgi:hypothetical protein
MKEKISGAVLVLIFYAPGSILVQAQTSKTVSPGTHQTVTHGCFYMRPPEIVKRNIKVPKEFARTSTISEQPLASQEMLSRTVIYFPITGSVATQTFLSFQWHQKQSFELVCGTFGGLGEAE